MLRMGRIAVLVLCVALGFGVHAFGADVSLAVSGAETKVSGVWDSGTITIAFGDSAGHSFHESFVYGQFSSAASIASTIGALFSRDYVASGLCAHAVGGVVYFHLRGAATFGAPSITNPSTSFSFSLTNWKVTPSITWPTPAPIAYGTTLGATQLNATAGAPDSSGAITSVAGSFLYNPLSGSTPAVGADILSTAFTPADTSLFNSATASVILQVQGNPALIHDIAGNATSGYTGEGSPATQYELNDPSDIAIDASGNIYIADELNNRVRKVTPGGVISTIAGTGIAGYTNDSTPIPASSAPLYYPSGVAVDAAGNVYIADSGNKRVRKVSSGMITTVAGNGNQYNFGPGPALGVSVVPNRLAMDSSGNLYITDSWNNVVYRLDATGNIIKVAGSGYVNAAGQGDFSGDNGDANSADLNWPEGIAVDTDQNIYIADWLNARIRKVTYSTGLISTVAGGGSAGLGDGGPATAALLTLPFGVAVDGSGNLYIGDTFDYRVRFVAASSGVISTLAGTGTRGYNGTNIPALAANLGGPEGIALDMSRNVYFADSGNSVVRKFDTTTQTPTISWVTPLPITYGTPLSATQLNASSNVPGTFSYTPGLGTVLQAGSYSLTVVFTPQDSLTYTATATSVPLVVNKATPLISWPQPSDITVGTSLSGTQLNASSTVAGVLSYSPGAGTALGIGPHTLTVTLTPSDSANYVPSTASTYVSVVAGTGTWDSGTVNLTVSGAGIPTTTVATTTYSQGATPGSIAAGLAANSAGNSLVNVSAVDDALNIVAKTTGQTSNYDYSIQTTSWDSTDFTYPSFASPAVAGSLDGGADASAGGSLAYSYTVAAGQYDGVGNVTQSVDSVMGTWNFSYDSLNRLVGATDNQPNNPNTNYCWGYDAFGNRKIQSGSPSSFQTGSPACIPATNAAFSSTWANYNNSDNRITSSSQAPSGNYYDAAGNITYDGMNQYLYDAEGRICAVYNSPADGISIMTGYVYDANGIRVAKGTITQWSCDPSINGFQTTDDYILGLSGEQLSELGVSSNGTMVWEHSNVYAAGKLIATYDLDGLHFYLTDPLGTRRVQTDYAGVIEQTCASLPYGDNLACAGSTEYPTEHHFTGKERDTESGNDYFGARYYASSMGRFMSPDWSPDSDEVPYADLENPQSLNLYSYVLNNPLSRTDSSGHASDPCAGIPNCVSVTADPPPSIPLFAMALGVGHHFIPQAIWRNLDKATQQWKFLNRLTSRALKNPRLSNPYDKLHRGVNRQTRELVEDLEKELGKSLKDFDKGDFEKLGERLERAGADIEKFNARLENLEPEARSFGEAMVETLEEIFPAAAETAVTTGEAAGAVVEGAAESGIIPPP